jgi:hypothetical protein
MQPGPQTCLRPGSKPQLAHTGASVTPVRAGRRGRFELGLVNSQGDLAEPIPCRPDGEVRLPRHGSGLLAARLVRPIFVYLLIGAKAGKSAYWFAAVALPLAHQVSSKAPTTPCRGLFVSADGHEPSIANLLLPPKSTCKHEGRQNASDHR